MTTDTQTGPVVVLCVVIAAGLAAAGSVDAPVPRDTQADAQPPPPVRHPSGRHAGPLRLDCVAGAPGCPSFEPIGDPADVLPGHEPSPFRGFADPSIRLDPVSGRLWMGYSWPHVEPAPASWLGVVGTPDIHLAVSDDGGVSWQYMDPLWTAEPVSNQGQRAETGFSGHEVVSLARHVRPEGTVWYGVHASYFVPDSEGLLTRRADSFHLRITQAPSPPELAGAVEAHLGSAFTAPGWDVDLDLSALDPAVAACAIWNEPALHMVGNTLYLATVCLVFDLATGARVPAAEHIALFATQPHGDVRDWSWRYAGRLAGQVEAAELGAETLTQVDLVPARDGTLLALVSPNDWDPALGADIHHGCRALEVASLEPPVLARTPAGGLRLRALITASDLPTYGPAACGYDPASATGIVIVRREWSTDEMVWSLHRTGLHP